MNELLQDLGRLDEAACDVTGEDDPATARQLLQDHLKQQKRVKHIGRPRRSATGMSDEKRRQITREMRSLRDERGLTWDVIGGRYDISDDTARKGCRWLDEEERIGIA